MKKMMFMILLMMFFLVACETKKVTITFDVSGFHVFPVESMEVKLGQKITLPEVYEPFYAFKGWYLDPDFEVEANEVIADQDRILYGLFEPILSIAVIGEASNSDHDQLILDIEAYALSNQRIMKAYRTSSSVFEFRDSAIETLDEAISDGAKIILLLAGWKHSEAVYVAQSEYPDIKFVLFGDRPKEHYFYGNAHIADNTLSIKFPGALSGFLAGYTAVMTGHENLGFLGNEKELSLEVGVGFIAGSYYAAREINKDIAIHQDAYWILDTSSLLTSTYLSKKMYNEGIDLIFTTQTNSIVVRDIAVTYDRSVIHGIGIPPSDTQSVIAKFELKPEVTVIRILDDFFGNQFHGGLLISDHCEIDINTDRFPLFYDDQYHKMVSMLEQSSFSIPTDYETLMAFLNHLDRAKDFSVDQRIIEQTRPFQPS